MVNKLKKINLVKPTQNPTVCYAAAPSEVVILSAGWCHPEST